MAAISSWHSSAANVKVVVTNADKTVPKGQWRAWSEWDMRTVSCSLCGELERDIRTVGCSLRGELERDMRAVSCSLRGEDWKLPAHPAACANHAPCLIILSFCINDLAAKNPSHLIIGLELGRIDTQQGRSFNASFGSASATG